MLDILFTVEGSIDHENIKDKYVRGKKPFL